MDESLKNSKRTENDLLKFTEQKRLLKADKKLLNNLTSSDDVTKQKQILN